MARLMTGTVVVRCRSLLTGAEWRSGHKALAVVPATCECGRWPTSPLTSLLQNPLVWQPPLQAPCLPPPQADSPLSHPDLLSHQLLRHHTCPPLSQEPLVDAVSGQPVNSTWMEIGYAGLTDSQWLNITTTAGSLRGQAQKHGVVPVGEYGGECRMLCLPASLLRRRGIHVVSRQAHPLFPLVNPWLAFKSGIKLGLIMTDRLFRYPLMVLEWLPPQMTLINKYKRKQWAEK